MILTLKKYSPYQVAIFLSASSMGFGLFREFLIVGLLGFSAQNDLLQAYLSIFYTIGLTIDAMKLACLNLYSEITLSSMLISASLICLPFCMIVTCIMGHMIHQENMTLLITTMLGGYFNLIAALLITYKQRNNVFLPAQVINVIPNFILIPGILMCYYSTETHMISAIIILTAIIPIVQCIALFMLPTAASQKTLHNKFNLIQGCMTFIRHFFSMLGEQGFQMIARSAFYNYGTGYLSIFAISVRVYTALKFILIDSYIGSKLFDWKKSLAPTSYIHKMISSNLFASILAITALAITLRVNHLFLFSVVQLSLLLVLGFYFSTRVRVLYFKINRYHNSASLVLRYALFELLFAFFAFAMTLFSHYPIFTLLWIGYIAKPFTQILLLRKSDQTISLNPEEPQWQIS
ncbi:MAG: hypothetical protein SFW66_05420 [Gammaproteobacteria bacterium]|nr:hypothetical protein [Gammaproteobacteria bacterium]